MEWLKDPFAGQWIVESTSGGFGGTVPNLLPQGFEAYVRVFHPMTRSAPGESREYVTWADAAADFGTHMGPLAQSARLLGREDPWGYEAVTSPSGWTYEPPGPGDLTNLPAVVRVLADHTTTSASVAAIWEGWGGLVSSQGRSMMAFATSGGRIGGAFARVAWTARAGYQRVRSHFAYREAPGTGVLPAGVATGPKLEMPGRAYFLARLDLADLCADDWAERVIWTDPPFVRTPSLLWPDDHAWCLATEIDFDTTLIGGTRDLAAALLAAPGLEALEIDRNASLMW